MFVSFVANLLHEIVDDLGSLVWPGGMRGAITIMKYFFEKFSENFLKYFCSFCPFENFSKNRSRRDDSFGPKIVKIRAILAIFRPFKDFHLDLGGGGGGV